jgi:diguanylate cyclase (GGDEF)-like protein
LQAAKSSGSHLILFHLDLDGFKSINDNFGQRYGDELLVSLPNRILATLRSGVMTDVRRDPCHLARLSGDEFALVIEGVESRETAQLIAVRIIDSVSEPFDILGVELRISISIGIASADVADYQFSTLLSHASAALKQEKELGKNGYCYFDEAISCRQVEQDKIEQLLRTALDEDGFNMVYQPIYCCDTQKLKGAEALIRCPEAIKLGVYPDVFIPIAEKVGLIRRLDLWVIETVFKTVCSLPETHEYRNLVYSINISALELNNTLFPSKLRLLLKKYPINVNSVQLEITETSLIALDERYMNVLMELNSIGVKLALDDFGMGYTAFNQLRKYPVHTLKIDRSFIMDLDTDNEKASSMVELILSLADLYDLEVTAEGVETQAQMEFLKTTRCDYVQGYALSRPIEWEAFLALSQSQVATSASKFSSIHRLSS